MSDESAAVKRGRDFVRAWWEGHRHTLPAEAKRELVELVDGELIDAGDTWPPCQCGHLMGEHGLDSTCCECDCRLYRQPDIARPTNLHSRNAVDWLRRVVRTYQGRGPSFRVELIGGEAPSHQAPMPYLVRLLQLIEDTVERAGADYREVWRCTTCNAERHLSPPGPVAVWCHVCAEGQCARVTVSTACDSARYAKGLEAENEDFLEETLRVCEALGIDTSGDYNLVEKAREVREERDRYAARVQELEARVADVRALLEGRTE